MSTTNQPAPSDNPGSTPGAIGGGQEGVDPAAIARGYENDGYDNASVISVPLMVIGFFVLAFIVTTSIFWYVNSQTADPTAHPAATARNAAPLNDRMGRTSRGGEVDQPRLEPLVLREAGSTHWSRTPLPQGNSPQIHPEQLRPSKENTPGLYQAGWVDQGKKIARISIDDAMKIAAENGVLKAGATEVKPVASRYTPTAANAGRGAGGSTVRPPVAAPKAEEKKAEPAKKPEEKKPDEKKGPEKK